MENKKLAENVFNMLLERKLTISTAESCTGGLLASAFVDLPGASSVFADGVVTYSNKSKCRMLGVKAETLETVGAVSCETAKQMAQGIAQSSETDIGLSTTGVAGPDGGTEEKPVGLVYIGVYYNGQTKTKELRLSGSRTEIRQKAVYEILSFLKQIIEQ